MSAVGHSALTFNPLSTPSGTQSYKNSNPGGSRSCRPTKCVLNAPPVPSQGEKLTNQHDLKEKIRKRLSDVKLELSPSAYDTAWAAMVPAGGSGPRFQQCLDWVMENQNPDGSWGLKPGHPGLVKDSLSCTLACVLALQKWNVGQRLVHRGLDYIGSNAWAASATDQFSPIGFNIVFPAMVNHAQKQDLILPLEPTLIGALHRSRDLEIRNGNVEYLAEGLGDSCNWEQILKRQRRNGSLFNSPAATAAALIHCPDDHKCSQYLASTIQSFHGWVPTVSPLHMNTSLRVVDTLGKLGVDRHFREEVHIILDEIYRAWLAKDEEIFSDISCLALAFRVLRLNGYDVSSEELADLADKEKFFNTYGVQDTGVTTCYELYKASQATIHEEEPVLDAILAWTRVHLKQQLQNQTILDKKLHKEVERDLKNYFGTLDRVGHRQSIEAYDVQEFQMLKTAYRCPTIHNEDFLQFSAQDFRFSQAQYQKDLKDVERWYVDCDLDYMNKGRNVVLVSTAFAAGVMADPELSQARKAFAQCSVLSTVMDDFFDHYGSKEESVGLVELVKNWDKKSSDSTAAYTSKESEIMFTAFLKTINDHADKAYAVQGRSVMNELHGLWLELIREYLNEKDWGDKHITNMEDYIDTAWITVAAKLCLCSATYFLGSKISEDLFTSEDFATMCFRSSLVGRLLNDFKTYKREHNEGALNSVWLLTAEDSISEEEAVAKVHQRIEQSRRIVLNMFSQGKGNSIPRRAEDLMWRICRIAHWLYFDVEGGDQFSKPDLNVDDIHALIWEPLKLLNSE